MPYLKWANISGILTSKNPLKTIQNTAFLSRFILIIIPQKMCNQALGVHGVYRVYSGFTLNFQKLHRTKCTSNCVLEDCLIKKTGKVKET